VIAQDPPGGTQVVQGTKVRINVSSGPKPIGVPPVIGQSFDSANSELQAAGFKVSRLDVDSNQPKDTVVDQSPSPNTFAGKGSTVTLKVSKGPQTSAVPDVTSEDESQATSDLQASGFKVKVAHQDTNDATQDGIVLTQSPGGGSQAKPGATVTITVGHFVQSTDTTTTSP
jgi:eukaryotic-like serine/threonine-protein kinase